MIEFKPFPKMARLSREIVITEKIDGTNAQVCIYRSLFDPKDSPYNEPEYLASKPDGSTYLVMLAGSRSRWLSRQTDNFGFAKWVQENADALFELGEGAHFGEWWGSGIQRGYGLPKGEKRFSLFNVGRWIDAHSTLPIGEEVGKEMAPACCHVVPVLHRGPFNTDAVNHVIWNLNTTGSIAAPGFMKPEGIVIFHTAGNVGFKKTIEGDEKPKSQA